MHRWWFILLVVLLSACEGEPMRITPDMLTAAARPSSTMTPTPTLIPPTPTATAIQLPTLTVALAHVHSADGADVRTFPSTLGSVLTTLPNDASVCVVGTTADHAWYHITSQGLNGWISGQLLTVPSDAGVSLEINIVALPTTVSTPTAPAR